jgi:rhodanese-related sulfurtransferase
MNQMRCLKAVLAVAIGVVGGTIGTAIAEETGNRYNLDRVYHSEISSAEAYVRGVLRDADGLESPETGIIIDVRSWEEYDGTWGDSNGGHPEGAYNIPFPHVLGRPSWGAAYIAQDPMDFYLAVDRLRSNLGLDYDHPMYLLCRTGFRSVLASNILATGLDGTYQPFTHVRNIWQGWVGREKPFAVFTDAGEVIAREGNGGKNITFVAQFTKDGEVVIKEGNNGNGKGNESSVVYLDLNNDGIINDDDKDGWSEYQGLPKDDENPYSWENQCDWLGYDCP